MKNTKRIIKIIGIILLAIILVFLTYIFSKKSQVTNITLNTQYIRIYEGEKFQIEANISDLVWESTNPGIVMVNSSGVIEGINAGEAKIVVSTKDGKVSNSCFVVVVKKEIESFELDKKEIIIQLDEENEIKPIIIPDDLNKEIVIWESSNPTIASVNESGKVKGISNGIAVIKAKVLNKEASSIVYVGKKANSIKISKEKEELEIGKSAKLNIEVTPTDALSERIIWESSDTSVVGIDDEGNITAKGIGTVEITATTEYSKIKDTCYVTVSKSEYEVKYMELDKVVKIKEGDALGTLPTITKDNYNFLGWYTSKDGGSKVSSTTIITGNMTLYPHWEIKETYMIGPGEGYYSKTVTYMGRTFKDYKQNRMPGGIPTGGCGPVSLLDILSGYGNTDINDIIKITGLSTSFTYINRAATNFGLQHSKVYAYKSGNGNDAVVKNLTNIAINALKKGHQLIVLVSRSSMCADCNGLPYDAFSWGNHFIAIVGLKKDGETAIILNPMEGRMEEGRMEDIIKYFLPGGSQSGFVEYWK